MNTALAILSRTGSAPVGSPSFTPLIGGGAGSPATSPLTPQLLATGVGLLFTRDAATRYFYYIDGSGNLWTLDSYNLQTAAVQIVAVAAINAAASGPVIAMKVGGDGNLYLAMASYVILKVLTASPYTVSVFVGSGTAGEADGTGTAATLNGIAAMDVDPIDGSYLIFREGGSQIDRKVTVPGGVVTTLGTGVAAMYYGFSLSISANGQMLVGQETQPMFGAIGTTGAGIGESYSGLLGPVALSPSGLFAYYFTQASSAKTLLRVQIAGNVTVAPIATLPNSVTNYSGGGTPQAAIQMDFGPLGIHVVDIDGNLWRIQG